MVQLSERVWLHKLESLGLLQTLRVTNEIDMHWNSAVVKEYYSM